MTSSTRLSSSSSTATTEATASSLFVTARPIDPVIVPVVSTATSIMQPPPAPPPPAAAPPKRRKFTPAQLALLESTYHRTTHPTREERETIAQEGGMDNKSILIWFQNKRSAERRSSARNTAPTTTATKAKRPLPRTQSLPNPVPTGDNSSLLDEIASMKERKQLVEREETPPVKRVANLWETMLSSPSDPPSTSSPDRLLEIKRRKRVHPKPNFPYAKGSLEWACANARANRWKEEDEETEAEDSTEESRKGETERGEVKTPESTRELAVEDDEMLRAAWALCGLSGATQPRRGLQRYETSHF